MARDTVLPVQVSRRQVGRFLATIFALDVAFLITTAMIYSNVVTRTSWGGWGYVFREALDVGAENNLAPWYSAITFLIAAVVWVICYALEVRGRRSTRARLLSWGWLLLAVLFCFLSLDEEGSFHERLGALPGVNRYDVLLIPGAAFGIVLLVFAWPRLRHSWLTLALPVFGVLAYLSHPLQERNEAILRRAGLYAATWHTPTLDVVMKEGPKLLGTLCFIAAGLMHARWLNRTQLPSMPGEQWLDFEISTSRRVITQVVGWIVGLMGLGFILVQFIAVPTLPHGSEFTPRELGSPPDWFAASLMLVAAALFLYGARGKTSGPGQRSPRTFYRLFSLYSVVLAIHHGGGHFLSSIVWHGSPRWQMATGVVLGLAALAVTAAGITQLPNQALRLAVAAWGALATAAAIQPEPVASLLLFAGYGLVLIVVAPVALVSPAGTVTTALAGASEAYKAVV